MGLVRIVLIDPWTLYFSASRGWISDRNSLPLHPILISPASPQGALGGERPLYKSAEAFNVPRASELRDSDRFAALYFAAVQRTLARLPLSFALCTGQGFTTFSESRGSQVPQLSMSVC